MKLIRIVGISELNALVKDGCVYPIKDRKCLYFFPARNERIKEYKGDAEWQEVPYRLLYLAGIVSSYYTSKLSGKFIRFFICLNLEIYKKRLQPSWETYADPYGSFFDTITNCEFHLTDGYDRAAVKSIDIYAEAALFEYADKIKTFTDIEEAKKWIEDLGDCDEDF